MTITQIQQRDNPATLQQLTDRDVKYCDNKDRGNSSNLLPFFNKWVADGTQAMNVLHEHGVYRHLRFKKPDRGEYWFDLITWPGNLTITGDMGTYTFARTEDMFTFFTGHINTGYWAEKEQARGRSGLKEHDGDEFKRWIVQDFWDTSRDMENSEAKEWWDAIRDNVFARYTSHDTNFREGCMEAIDEIISDGAPSRHYEDMWELEWDKYPWHLELCMAAIVTGIRTYNAVKKAEFLADAMNDPEGQRLAAAALALAEAQK